MRELQSELKVIQNKGATCLDCNQCLTIDYGWSNWTVEGESFYCLLKQHPDDGFDRWYGEDDRLKYAEVCPAFVLGEGIAIDVDRKVYETMSAKDYIRMQRCRPKEIGFVYTDCPVCGRYINAPKYDCTVKHEPFKESN